MQVFVTVTLIQGYWVERKQSSLPILDQFRYNLYAVVTCWSDEPQPRTHFYLWCSIYKGENPTYVILVQKQRNNGPKNKQKKHFDVSLCMDICKPASFMIVTTECAALYQFEWPLPLFTIKLYDKANPLWVFSHKFISPCQYLRERTFLSKFYQVYQLEWPWPSHKVMRKLDFV